MTIYIDVLFLKELSINILIIYLTSRLIDKKVPIERNLLFSILGGVSTIVCLIVNKIVIVHLIRVLIMFTIIYGVFKTKSINEFIKTGIAFYMVTFLISGVILYSNFNKLKLMFYIFSIVIVFVSFIKQYKERFRVNNFIINLNFESLFDDIKCEFSALIDTGNSLESNFGEDVIVISPRIVKKLKNEFYSKILLDGEVPFGYSEKKNIRLINFNSLGNKNDMKYGIKVDGIKFEKNGRVINKSAVIIASDFNFNEYDAIVRT